LLRGDDVSNPNIRWACHKRSPGCRFRIVRIFPGIK
jgi:hypothetical protein